MNSGASIAGSSRGGDRELLRRLGYAAGALALSGSVDMPQRRLRSQLARLTNDYERTRAARSRLDAMRARGAIHTIADLDVRARKRSSTVFVLGSGSSVNELSAPDWDVVANHDSIGFNHWLIHPFVPTLYFVELNTERREEDEYMMQLLCRRLPDIRDLPVVAESKCWLEPGGVSLRLPRELRDTLYFHAPYYLPTTSVDLVAWVLRWARRCWRSGSCDFARLIHHRASLSVLVLFAYLAGYREIVLVGVDLNDSVYFWEADPSYLGGQAGPPDLDVGAVHLTIDPAATTAEAAVPIDEYLAVLDSAVLRPDGVRLSVANPVSKLAEILPVYQGLSQGAGRAGFAPRKSGRQT